MISIEVSIRQIVIPLTWKTLWDQHKCETNRSVHYESFMLPFGKHIIYIYILTMIKCFRTYTIQTYLVQKVLTRKLKLMSPHLC